MKESLIPKKKTAFNVSYVMLGTIGAVATLENKVMYTRSLFACYVHRNNF